MLNESEIEISPKDSTTLDLTKWVVSQEARDSVINPAYTLIPGEGLRKLSKCLMKAYGTNSVQDNLDAEEDCCIYEPCETMPMPKMSPKY